MEARIMALNLSKKDQERLEADLRAAEPYKDNDPALLTLDGDVDSARWRATMAKKLLQQAGVFDEH